MNQSWSTRSFIAYENMNLTYKIPNKEEYPAVLEAIYKIFILGIFEILNNLIENY